MPLTHTGHSEPSYRPSDEDFDHLEPRHDVDTEEPLDLGELGLGKLDSFGRRSSTDSIDFVLVLAVAATVGTASPAFGVSVLGRSIRGTIPKDRPGLSVGLGH